MNRVGVDVNSASATLLSYVSGIGPTLARAIVTHREAAGPFATRHDLLQVPRFGAKAFEQSAGFLRVRDGAEALDATAVHPESYYIVETISRSIATDQSSDVKRAQSVFDLGRKIPSERPCPVSHRGGRSSGFRQLDDPVHYNDRPSPMSLTPGTSVGPYAVRAQIGTGGMGVVYAAHDPRLDRQVAIKVLSPDRIRDDAAKRRFVQEAKAASALDHPNICAIHEINETDDGQLYLVMAYYDGETLERRIERGPLALDEAVDIATQAACGLAEAHAARMVHRDIKPANLLVATDGVVKILDFGLAKLIGSEGVTQTGTTVGTVAYMSPEQARGRWVDHRTDIWSLGVVLYEMQMEDVFAIQDDVSQAIVDVLRVKLLPASAPPVADRYTEDVHAYQLYLQGRHHWHKHTEDGYARSLDCFTRAIAHDPSYAQPYVGLAHLYLWTGFLGSSPASEAYPKAKESALKALQLDETIGDAHSALGFVLTQYEWDWTGAQSEFKRAIELAPHSIDTLQAYSVYLMNLGPIEEAIDLIKREIELDPLFAKAHQIWAMRTTSLAGSTKQKHSSERPLISTRTSPRRIWFWGSCTSRSDRSIRRSRRSSVGRIWPEGRRAISRHLLAPTPERDTPTGRWKSFAAWKPRRRTTKPLRRSWPGCTSPSAIQMRRSTAWIAPTTSGLR